MRKILLILFVGALMQSCVDPFKLSFGGIDQIVVNNVAATGIDAEIIAFVSNSGRRTVVIREADVDIFSGTHRLCNVILTEPLTVRGRSDDKVTAHVRVRVSRLNVETALALFDDKVPMIARGWVHFNVMGMHRRFKFEKEIGSNNIRELITSQLNI